jgi:hypothetical protein
MQAISPMILIVLTRFRAPVSTSFLLLGVFATKSSAFLGVINKSLIGFGVAFVIAIVF